MNATRLIITITLLLSPLAAEDNLKFGEPACDGKLLDKRYFVVCYDPNRKVPAWVGYALTQSQAKNKTVERKGKFVADPDAGAQGPTPADYAGRKRLGLDIGHMAPADDFRRSAEAMKATFVLTNAVPQNLTLNRGKWAQVEGAVQNLAEAGGAVWVLSGPAFLGASLRRIGPHRVAVPTHVFKVVLHVRADGTKEMFGYLFPNVKPAGDLDSYAMSVSRIEKAAGLDFFAKLGADESKLEREVHTLLPGR